MFGLESWIRGRGCRASTTYVCLVGPMEVYYCSLVFWHSGNLTSHLCYAYLHLSPPILISSNYASVADVVCQVTNIVGNHLEESTCAKL